MKTAHFYPEVLAYLGCIIVIGGYNHSHNSYGNITLSKLKSLPCPLCGLSAQPQFVITNYTLYQEMVEATLAPCMT